MNFLTQDQIEVRDMLAYSFTRQLRAALAKVNNAFRFIRIETPVRRETVLNAFLVAQEILNVGAEIKHRLPLVLWEYGRILNVAGGPRWVGEQTQLEYHVLFSDTTVTPYLPILQETCLEMLSAACNTTSPLIRLQEKEGFAYGKAIEIVIDMNKCV